MSNATEFEMRRRERRAERANVLEKNVYVRLLFL